jgi:hypothetical protein
LCIAAICLGASAPAAAEPGASLITLSLHAVGPTSPSTPPWLAPGLDRATDTAWGVPRAWLHGLDTLDRAPLSLGGALLRTADLALRIDGLLRVNADYPSLTGHVDLDWRGRRASFALPSVQVIPQRVGGQLYCGVQVMLDHKF